MTIQRMHRLQENLLRVGELARQAGMPVSTVRYYTQVGLISPATRTSGGHNLYDRQDCLRVLNLIKTLNRNRPPLNQLKGVLAHSR